MSFKLSGPPTKDDIKVAYIDPILGLVEGVSINEANKYALKDPGTTFIFRDGNLTLQYLNINEVNKLNPAVDLVKSDDKCGGPEGGANGGGGIAVLYRQGNVLVVCGGGGGAGTSGRGGDGGGIGVGGENGQGRDNGAGGYSIQTGTLDMSGSFAGGTQAGPTFNPIYKTGGKLSKCTIGNYWRNRGVSPCSTMGNVQSFTYNGTAISGSTSSIIRGYKAGIAYRNNGGNGSGNEGGGGAGVVGGNAATGSGAGGGGASGYSSGEVTIVSTQRGGNDGFAYAYIELLS